MLEQTYKLANLENKPTCSEAIIQNSINQSALLDMLEKDVGIVLQNLVLLTEYRNSLKT